ncbi:MAG: sporulation protein YabP [Halothermotrichaceae bacterium]
MDKNNSIHNLSLNNRKDMSMDGVKEVVSFDENKIILQTTQGNLYIKGDDLNIQKLNLENSNIKISGHITLLEYTDKIDKKGILNRLFK